MIVIVIGVLMAIATAFTNILPGGTQSALIVSASGVLTNAVGVLFHRQANKALAHMEKQTQNLQKDMRADQDGRTAIELIEHVSSNELKDQLLASVALRLANAELAKSDLAARQKSKDKSNTHEGTQ